VFEPVKIAPSILSADFLNLERDVRMIEEGRPEFLHVDVMDGHFVPNLTIGPVFVKSLKQITTIPLDVHLMISNPAAQLDWYLDAGASLVTIHVEAAATNDIAALLHRIKQAGAQAGLSLNPETPAQAVFPYLEQASLILVMSVHPGFGGQSFIEGSVDKVAAIAARAQALGVNPLLEVDGGINATTAPLVTAQGADVLVAGNAIFAAPNPLAALAAIRAAANPH
jgi:ribulose-phosphate 3-epimerase